MNLKNLILAIQPFKLLSLNRKVFSSLLMFDGVPHRILHNQSDSLQFSLPPYSIQMTLNCRTWNMPLLSLLSTISKPMFFFPYPSFSLITLMLSGILIYMILDSDEYSCTPCSLFLWLSFPWIPYVAPSPQIMVWLIEQVIQTGNRKMRI